MIEDSPRPYLKWALGGLGVLAAITAVIILIMMLAPAKPVETPPPTTFPSASSTGARGTATISVAGKRGPVVVTDFIHNGETEADPQNPGIYYLAGSPGYCLSDGTCPSGFPTEDFNITYDATRQFFTIALLAEPLGGVRATVEEFMLKRLGISEIPLCTLNYYLGTVSALNDQYAGRNLGFSFCPNATVLP